MGLERLESELMTEFSFLGDVPFNYLYSALVYFSFLHNMNNTVVNGAVPAHAVAHEPMRADVDAVSHFQPHVVVAELLIILAAWLSITDLHSDILSLLKTQIDGQAAHVYIFNICQYMSYLINNGWCRFAILCHLRRLLTVLFGCKHGGHSNHGQRHFTRDELD